MSLRTIHTESAPAQVGRHTRAAGLWADLRDGLELWHAWYTKAWFDIKLRYRRTLIGPFWMVLSTGLLIACFGLIAPILFRSNDPNFFVYLSVGVISWNFISLTINELSGAFIEQRDEIRSVRLPFSIYLYRVIARDLITYAHLLLIYVLVAIIFAINAIAYVPLFLLGLALITLNFVWLGFVLGMVCVRFRDIQQVIASVISIGFLITPVFWDRTLVLGHGARSLIVHLNPFAHMIEVLRGPLLREVPALEHYGFLLGALAVGFPCAAYMYRRYIGRVVFWV